MSSTAVDSLVWKAKRDELVGRLRIDDAPGVADWLDTVAQSMGSGDADAIVGSAIAESSTAAGGDSRTAAAYALKAAWLEAAGSTKEAADASLEAGKRYSWLGEPKFKLAIDLLTRALELDPDLAAAYWNLAEVWRIKSFVAEPPYVSREPLDEGLAIWNRGAARQLPDASNSWAYRTRAMISEQLAMVDDGRRISWWWDAVCYLERAILLDDSDADHWAILGRHHRLLENESCALDATAEALRRGPDNSSALDERAAILADTGRFDEALQVLEQRLAKDRENTWARGVKAFVLANRKDYRAALILVDQVIAAEPDNIWNLDLRALCCWMLDGEREHAVETYQRILEIQSHSPSLSIDDRHACAYAAYKLGKVDDAIHLLETLVGDGLVRGDVRRTLGLCYFVKASRDAVGAVPGGVVRAEELLLSGLARARIHELETFLAADLADLEARSPQWSHVGGAVAAFRRIKKTTAALISGLSSAATTDLRALAVEELTTVAQVLPDDDVSRMNVGAQAGLARLKIEQQQWKEAAEAYRALQHSGKDMFEAGFGIERSLEGIRADARGKAAAGDFASAAASFGQLLDLQSELGRADQLSATHEEIGDALWRAGDGAALEHFQQALARVPSGERDARLCRLHVRVGLALQQRGDGDGVRSHYLAALERQRDIDGEHPGEALGSTVRALIRDLEQFWAVDAVWGELEADAAVADRLRRDIAVARASALTYVDDLFGLSKHADSSIAVSYVTPIALEVGSGLIPMVDPKSDGGTFLFTDIPAMRNDIESSTGVWMPGIRARGDETTSDRYTILLDEVPTAAGTVRVGSRYTLASADELTAAGARKDDVVEAIDPVSGTIGRWCSPAHADALTKRGVATAVQTETQFVLAHVGRVLRQHLDEFFGVQELRSLLTALKNKDTRMPEVEMALNDDAFALRFARILRALAREQVPIVRWNEFMATVQRMGFESIEEGVARIRKTVRNELPGNQQGVEHLELPADWAARANITPEAFGVSPADAHRLLAEIRSLLQQHVGPVSLVASDGRLRSLVTRLIDFEFPGVSVLSRDEVV